LRRLPFTGVHARYCCYERVHVASQFVLVDSVRHWEGPKKDADAMQEDWLPALNQLSLIIRSKLYTPSKHIEWVVFKEGDGGVDDGPHREHEVFLEMASSHQPQSSHGDSSVRTTSSLSKPSHNASTLASKNDGL
jgi:hypothetical protein